MHARAYAKEIIEINYIESNPNYVQYMWNQTEFV